MTNLTSNSRVRLYPYRTASSSAKELSRSINALRLKHSGSRFRARQGDVIINWGAEAIPAFNCSVWNANVQASCNKLSSFRLFSEHGVKAPAFSTSLEDARNMLNNGPVVCRTLLRGHSGRGIVIADDVSELVQAPLYTQYIKKQSEYRVHVFFGEVIDIQKKMRRSDTPDSEVDWRVRNHSNGFVYGRDEVRLPDGAQQLCIEAVSALGLDFGAVDIIHNAHYDEYYVLEVNTAPGLSGTTLEVYTDAFIKKLEDSL